MDKLSKVLVRRFAGYLRTIPDSSFAKEMGGKASVLPATQEALFRINEGATETQLRRIWVACLRYWLFSKYLRMLRVKVPEIRMAAQIQRKATSAVKKSEIYNGAKVTQIRRKPLIFALTFTSEQGNKYGELLLADESHVATAYYIPDQSLVLYRPMCDPSSDTAVRDFTVSFSDSEFHKSCEALKHVLSLLFADVQQIQADALMTRTLNEQATLRRLFVLTPREVVGTANLEGIEMHGTDVMAGLRGLRMRQELNLNLHEVGPWTEADSEHISLIVPIGIRLFNEAALAMLPKLAEGWMQKTGSFETGAVVFDEN